MIDIEILAENLLAETQSAEVVEWLENNIPGLAVKNWPDERAMSYRAMASVAGYWHELPKVEGVAETIKVDPTQVKPALGSIILLDVIEGGRDFRYSLYGSRIAEASGFDMTGKLLSELPTVSPIQMFFHAGYLAVVRRRRPLFTIHRAPEDIMIGNWNRLQLPLGTDGEVTRLMVCNVAARPDGQEK